MSLFGIARIEIDASIGTMLVFDDPAHIAHEDYKEQFGTDEVLSIAVPLSDPFSLDWIRVQQRVVDRLELVSGVLSVDALVTEDDVVGAQDELVVRPLIQSDPGNAGYDLAEKAALRERVAAHPVWRSWLISDDLEVIAFQVRLDDSTESLLGRAETMDRIDVILVEEFGRDAFFLAGHPFMKSEISRSIASDLARLLPITFCVMAVLLLVITRSVCVGGLTACAVLLSVIWMIGAMGWFGLGITALTNAAPTILIALATAYFLHFSAAYQSTIGASGVIAAAESLRRVARPMWIAATTTAIGYASLSLSSVPIVREFGISLAIGVMSTAIVGSIALPSAFSLVALSRSRGAFSGSLSSAWGLFRLARFVCRAPVSILLVAFALGLSMAVSATMLEVDSSGPKRFDQQSRFSVSSRFYRERLSGDVLESVYLKSRSGDFLQPDRLRRLQLFQEAALEIPEIDKVISIADHIARIYWVFRGEKGDPSQLPDSHAAVSQLLLIYESAGGRESIEDLISSDSRAVKIMIKADVQSSRESAELREDLDSLVDRFFADEELPYSVVSTEMLLSKAADVIAVEQVRSALVALAVVLIFVSLSFGSVKAGALMLGPNAVPLIVNLGVMGLLGIALSDATSIITATAIGIAVDSTVHLLSAAQWGESRFSSVRAGVLGALVLTGRPVVVAGLVVSLGFSILLFSDFRSVAELGALTALTMVYCLVADLLILPAQLVLIGKKGSELVPVFIDFGTGIGVGLGRWDEERFVVCHIDREFAVGASRDVLQVFPLEGDLDMFEGIGCHFELHTAD